MVNGTIRAKKHSITLERRIMSGGNECLRGDGVAKIVKLVTAR